MAEISAQEITQLIKAQLAGVTQGVDVDEVGTVVSVGDGIALAYGLDKVMAGELVEFPNGVYGLALNLEEGHVRCVLMGETSLVKESATVQRTKRIRSDNRSTARARSRLRSSTRSSASPPASSTECPSRNRCRPASRRSTR